MNPRSSAVAAAASLAVLLGVAAACGGSGADATPVSVPTPASQSPSPGPTFVSVLDPQNAPTTAAVDSESAGGSVEAPVPTPTFDPGDVILPTVVAPTPVAVDAVGAEAELERRLDEIEPRVAALRELYVVRDTDRRFIGQAELDERLADDLSEAADELEEFGRLYSLLGVTEPGTDLYEMFFELYSSNVLGFFDTELNELYVVGDGASDLSPQDHLTYAHEFVHALQQQHFDINSVLESDEIESNSDRSAAYRALIEGDATLLETIYMFQNMTPEEQVVAQDLGVDLTAFFATPHLVQRSFLFPYVEGAQFVLQTFARSGWKGVNELYGRAPVSTEQVLHAGKYEIGEGPVAVDLPNLEEALEEALGAGWSEAGRDTFGEFALLAYLETWLAPGQAATAAAGWGGDLYALYVGPDDPDDPDDPNDPDSPDRPGLLVQRIVWDTIDDASEFFGAFVIFTQTRLRTEWDLVEGDGGGIRMVLPDQVIFVRADGKTTDLVFAPDEAVLGAVLAALGLE